MLLGKLVEHLDEANRSPLDGDTLDAVRLFVLNAAACAFEDPDAHDALVALRVAASCAGGGRSTLWLTGKRVWPLEATYANCISLHGSVKEDTLNVTDNQDIHPGTPVIPAAIAVGEHIEASGAAVARSIVVGFEAIGQLARLLLTRSFRERGWRHTAVMGGFGSAAAAGSLLDLPSEAMLNALALAGNVAGGLCAYKSAGTSDHSFSNASGARNGVEAALLAREGGRAAPALLEAPLGFIAAFNGGSTNELSEWPVLGELEIRKCYLKQYDSAAANQESIEAVRRMLLRRPIRATDVARVTVRTYKRATEKSRVNPGPFTGHYSAMVSGKFCMAAMLLDGDLTPQRYLNYGDPAISELTSLMTVEVDPEAERSYPRLKISTVSMDLKDGTRLEERVEDLPEVGFSDVVTRFVRLASPALGEEKAKLFAERTAEIEKLGSVAELTTLLHS